VNSLGLDGPLDEPFDKLRTMLGTMLGTALRHFSVSRRGLRG